MAAAVELAVAASGVESPVEWLQMVSSRVSMYLHPSYADNVESGAREVLNSQLIRYDESYGGVLLGYLRMQILNHGHKILPLFPYFSVKLRADMLIFAPKAGMIIEGKVNRVLKDHIELLVLGFFNAVVGASDMREDLFYDEELECWMSATDRRHCIMNGCRVSFLVKSVQELEQFIDITGSLMPSNTGALDWLSAPIDVQEVEGRKEKRKKRKSEAAESLEAQKRIKEGGAASQLQIPPKAADKAPAESSTEGTPVLEDGFAAVAYRKAEALANDESKHKKKKKKTKMEDHTAVKQETFQAQHEKEDKQGTVKEAEQQENAAALKSRRKHKKDKQQQDQKEDLQNGTVVKQEAVEEAEHATPSKSGNKRIKDKQHGREDQQGRVGEAEQQENAAASKHESDKQQLQPNSFQPRLPSEVQQQHRKKKLRPGTGNDQDKQQQQQETGSEKKHKRKRNE